MRNIRLVTLNGASQLAWSEDPAALAPGILAEYYGSSPPHLPDFRAGRHGDRPIDENLLEELGSDCSVEEILDRSADGQSRHQAGA